MAGQPEQRIARGEEFGQQYASSGAGIDTTSARSQQHGKARLHKRAEIFQRLGDRRGTSGGRAQGGMAQGSPRSGQKSKRATRFVQRDPALRIIIPGPVSRRMAEAAVSALARVRTDGS